MAMASRQGSSANAAAAADFDPVYECLNRDGSYLLRLNLPGFKKEDFRVHVDSAGRLTVIGQGPAKLRCHKVFQLPSMSNLDEITGRFDGSVLSLTVPKLPHGAVAPAPPKAKEEAGDDDFPADKTTDQKSKVGREAARARLTGRQRDEEEEEDEVEEEQTGRSKKPRTEKKKGDEVGEPKAEETADLSAEKAAAKGGDHEDVKAKVEHKAKVAREAERRIEAARARLAAEAGEREKKGCWKVRAAEEGLKWAEAVGKNKEVIATAVAAFALGVFVSHKLFSRN